MQRLRQKTKNIVAASALMMGALGAPQTAVAEDRCTDAKQLVKAMKSFFQTDAKLTNVIAPTFDLSMTTEKDGPPLSGLLYRNDGEEHKFKIDENDRVLGLESAVDKLSPKGELCPLIDDELVDDADKNAVQASVSFTFPYLNQTGQLTADEVFEGAKDASKVMKSLAPGGLGFVVPKMKSLILSPIDLAGDAPPPRLSFMKNGVAIDGPDPVWLNGSQYYHLSDIKKIKADMILIEGGYNLQSNFAFKDEELQAAETALLEKLANPDTDDTSTPESAPEASE